jgi:hypothetical protein
MLRNSSSKAPGHGLPRLPKTTSEVTRSDGRKLRRTTVYLKPEVHERLKKAVRLSGSDGSSIINGLLEDRLSDIIRKALEDLKA